MAAPEFGALPEETREALLRGIDAFNAGRFWDAHEAWEEPWLAAEGLDRLWLQGLIQLTAACHKGLRMGGPRGMASLFEQAGEKLEAVAESGDAYGGIHLRPLIEFARLGRQCALSWMEGRRDGFDENLLPVIERPAQVRSR